MGKISSIRVDPEKDVGGVWCNYEIGIRLKIARMGNPKFDEEVSRLTKETGKGWKELSDDEQDEIIMIASSKYVLVDWENVEDDDGKLIPYSSQQALEYFQDESYRYFYRFVLAKAGADERYRVENIEATAKN